MKPHRITLFAGHYGSGKTNIAINYAEALAAADKAVTVADLDIVNPYFRSADSRDRLAAQGIQLLSSPYAGSNVDLPALPQEMYAIVDDTSRYAVLDIGGDDRGALALGRYAPGILKEGDYAFYLVINGYRPLSHDAPDTLEILREIEAAGGIRATALVNNSNLGPETTAQTVLDSLSYAEEVSRRSGLPIAMTTVDARLLPELQSQIPHLLGLTLQARDFF